MKKYILIFSFCLFFLGMNTTNAALYKHRTGFYMDVFDKHLEVLMFEDEDTKLPVFRIQYETDAEDSFLFDSVSNISLSEEEILEIKNIIAVVTEGKRYVDLDYRHLIGTQILIWEVWQRHVGIPFSFTFDVGFVKDYRELLKKKEDEVKVPERYFYETTIDKPITISYLPFFSHSYTIMPLDNSFSVVQNENEFQITPNESGTFHFRIDSDYFEEQVKYFSDGKTDIIELSKQKILNSEIVLKVNPLEKQKHSVHVSSEKGVSLVLLDTEFFFKDKVEFQLQLEEGYVLDKMFLNGKEISFIDNFFVMPDEDVIITFLGHFKPSIEVPFKEGIHFDVPFYKEYLETVTFSYQLEPQYTLDYLEIYTIHGEKVLVTDFSFVMPKDPVIFFYSVSLKESEAFDIFVNSTEKINIKKQAEFQEKVSFSYTIDSDYEITSLKVYTLKNQEIEIQNKTFLMPNEPVILELKVEKKEPISYSIFVPSSSNIQFDILSYSKPNTKVAIKYQLSSSYHLSSFHIYTASGKEIDCFDSAFLMPRENVFITYELTQKEKKKHTIFVNPTSNVFVSAPPSSYEGEEVSFSYVLNESVILEDIVVTDLKGNYISLFNNSFLMPSSDVVITFRTTPFDVLNYEVPNTKKNKSIVLFLPILGFFFLLKRKEFY